MPRLPVPGSDHHTWGDLLNEYLGVSHNDNGTLQTQAVAQAGGITSINGVAPTNGAIVLASNDVGSAPSLTPTDVKIAAYTANPGDFVPVDASTASVIITLPTVPGDGSRIEVKMINTTKPHTVTVQTGGSDVFNKAGGNTTLVLSLIDQAVTVQYAADRSIWYVQDDDLELSQLDSRFASKPQVTDLVTYVSTNGNDANDGLSWGSAKRTVGAALTMVNSTGGVVNVGAGIYYESMLPLPSNGASVIIRGSGANYPSWTLLMANALATSASGDLFSVPANCNSCVFEDIALVSGTANGGGHIFNASTSNVSGFIFNRCYFSQTNSNKCIWYTTDALVINCTWRNCTSQHTSDATIPSWQLKSSGGGIQANTWENIWHTYTGNYAILIESTSSSSYSDGNVFRNFTWEECTGGLIKLLGARYSHLQNLIAYDNYGSYDTIRNDSYYFGKGAGNLICWGIDIDNVQRLAGTLGAGVVDIRCNAMARSKISSSGGTIDLNNQDVLTYNLLEIDTATVLNRNSSMSIDVTAVTGTVLSPSFSASGLNTSVNASSRYVGATASGPPITGNYLIGDYAIDQTGKVWIYATNNTWVCGSGVALDPNAADVQPLGNQSAGSTGKAADAGHVHPAPPSDWLPADNGFVLANGDYATLSGSTTLAAGVMYLAKLPLRQAAAVSSVCLCVRTAGSGSSRGSYVGLYSSTGTLLTKSADIGSGLSATGLQTFKLTATQQLTTGSFVWVAILVNLATTQPTLLTFPIAGAQANLHLSASGYRFANYTTVSLTTLPAGFSPASALTTPTVLPWVATL
jgi:hypothetical protein